METLVGQEAINPLLLYLGCGLGAVGVIVAMPRRGLSLALFGLLIGALGVGLLALGLGIHAGGDGLPNPAFYVFGAIALASALRMITHPRPVYAALYFILTVIASSGLYLLLSAEFMAFALIIIYAGAILITYLFVIMLATQTPTEEEGDNLSDYDATAREPAIASAFGFVLVAVLTNMLTLGTPGLPAAVATGDDALIQLPERLQDGFAEAGLLSDGERLVIGETGRVVTNESGAVAVIAEGSERRYIERAEWPADLSPSNVERVGLNLLRDHPMTIEIAGVILLMAMLGATVLARKQVDLEEEAKAHQAKKLAETFEKGTPA
ncbi:MAG: NADH-quinone oxidoreductase subunit J [Planctomycetota bacterium]